jgi:hypothetical protein
MTHSCSESFCDLATSRHRGPSKTRTSVLRQLLGRLLRFEGMVPVKSFNSHFMSHIIRQFSDYLKSYLLFKALGLSRLAGLFV